MKYCIMLLNKLIRNALITKSMLSKFHNAQKWMQVDKNIFWGPDKSTSLPPPMLPNAGMIFELIELKFKLHYCSST